MLIKRIYKKSKQIFSINKAETLPQINEANSKLIRNVFNKQHSKNALISFITYGMDQSIENLTHTNILECNTICELLNELDYNVDLIDYDNTNPSIRNIYDLIVGFGVPIENILVQGNDKNFKLILYRNGCDQSFADQASLLRVEEVFKRTGKLLISSSRISPGFWRAQIRFADLIIALGNKFVADTYQNETSGRIESLDLFYYDVNTIDLTIKNFEASKRNFLWFGSFGAIHKGLDLVIDYFSRRPDLELFICGLNSTEKEFIELYQQKLALPNIHNLGFVQLQSKQFKEILYACGAILTPSVSEAGAPATLNVIASGGLIPILTANCGVSFDGNEIIIQELSERAINIAIDSFSEIPPDNLMLKSIAINKFVRERYTYKKFRNNLKSIISKELKIVTTL
ncbi:MAG: glycosyltransferase [Ferruginibacter sp.]